MKAFIFTTLFCLISGCQSVSDLVSLKDGQGAAMIARAEHYGPQMRVQIASRGADALLYRVAVNDDVETWLTVDNISLSFRQGVLVATRGVGFDLMGADALATLTALEGRGEPVYRRHMRYLTGENHSTYLMAGCRMESAPDEIIDGQNLARYNEICIARQHAFTNIFWKDASGTIIVSRQWISPEIGYLRNSDGK